MSTFQKEARSKDSREVVENGVKTLQFTIEYSENLIKSQENEKKQLEAKLQQRKAECFVTETKLAESKQKLKEVESKILTVKDELIAYNTHKKQAAERIIQQFPIIKKIHVKDQTELANEIFKWLLVIIYNETHLKYEFRNFIQQSIKNDSGNDFGERLKGFRAFGLGKDEVATTDRLITMEDSILKELHTTNPQSVEACKDIFIYVRLIHAIAKHTEKLHSFDKEYEQALTRFDIENAYHTKTLAKVESTQEDIQYCDKTITHFSSVLSMAQKTMELCKQKLGTSV